MPALSPSPCLLHVVQGQPGLLNSYPQQPLNDTRRPVLIVWDIENVRLPAPAAGLEPRHVVRCAGCSSSQRSSTTAPGLLHMLWNSNRSMQSMSKERPHARRALPDLFVVPWHGAGT